MVDFACKRFNVEEIVKCSLGLTRSELTLFLFFLRHSLESYATEQLGKETGLDLSTVQRCVKKLHERGVLSRNQFNLKSGGYKFVYQVKDKKDVRKVISDIVQKWADGAKEEIGKW